MSARSPSSGSSPRATTSSSSTTSRPAIARPSRDGAALEIGSYGDGAALGRPPRARADRRDPPLRAPGRSSASRCVEPARYYRDNVAGGIALLDAARTAGVGRVVFSSTAAVYGVPDVDADPRGRAAPARSTRTARRSGRSRARSAATARPYGLRSVSPPLLQRRRRDRAERRAPRPRDAPDPERPRGRPRTGRAADALRRRLPDARRDVHPRLHPRRRPRRRPSPGARGDRAAATRGRTRRSSATSASAAGSASARWSPRPSASSAGRSRRRSGRARAGDPPVLVAAVDRAARGAGLAADAARRSRR